MKTEINKIKLLICLTYFLSFSCQIFPQSFIEEIFLKIPIKQIDSTKRKILIEHKNIFQLISKSNNDIFIDKRKIPKDIKNSTLIEFKINQILPKNGFLSFEKIIVNSDSGMHFDLCYWNKSNGEKLIAIRYFPYGTDTYDSINFYLFSNESNILKEVNYLEVIPELKFIDLVNTDKIIEDGLIENELLKIFDKIILYGYNLPAEGKNLDLKIYPVDFKLKDESEIEILNKYSKYIKKNIILKWNDGDFKI